MKLDEHLCNQTVCIIKIVGILMEINCVTVKKIIEKPYEDVMEDADKSEQDKKTYLIGIINEVTTVM